MPTDNRTSDLIINQLTEEQYAQVFSPSENELWVTPDNTDELIANKQDRLIAGRDIELVKQSLQLPSDYEELEYIQGLNNVQYINTNIIPTKNMNIYMKCTYISGQKTVSFTPFGARNEAPGDAGVNVFLGASINTKFECSWFGTNYSVSGSVEDNDVYEYIEENNYIVIKKNDTTVFEHTFVPSVRCNYPIFINAIDNAGLPSSTQKDATLRIHRFTIYGLCDMVPVKKISTNTYGMYDLIRKTFYGNAGTGSFTPGPVVAGVPSTYTPIEYLQSTGTQYIDTGYKVNNNTRVLMEVLFDAYDVRPHWLFGARSNSTNNYGVVFRFQQALNNLRDDYGSEVSLCNATSNLVAKTLILDKNKNVFRITDDNTTLLTNTTSVQTFTGTVNLFLFGLDDNGGLHSDTGQYKLYSCKIWDNNVLVRDFRPALDALDIPCLYDSVTSTAFYNSGNGTFIAGPRTTEGVVINFTNESGYALRSEIPTTVVFEQAAAATTWYIQHNLGKYPSVVAVDSAGAVIGGKVTYVDINNIEIEFNAQFTGKAFLN